MIIIFSLRHRVTFCKTAPALPVVTISLEVDQHNGAPS